jgi:hypothetical protein
MSENANDAIQSTLSRWSEEKDAHGKLNQSGLRCQCECVSLRRSRALKCILVATPSAHHQTAAAVILFAAAFAVPIDRKFSTNHQISCWQSQRKLIFNSAATDALTPGRRIVYTASGFRSQGACYQTSVNIFPGFIFRTYIFHLAKKRVLIMSGPCATRGTASFRRLWLRNLLKTVGIDNAEYLRRILHCR